MERNLFLKEVNSILDTFNLNLQLDTKLFGIILRGLIDLAFDDMERLRYLSSLYGEDSLVINVYINKEEGSLTIFNNGVGMTKQDLHNLCNSYPKHYQSIFTMDDIHYKLSHLGFLGVYFLCDRVTIFTKNHEDVDLVWEGDFWGTPRSYLIQPGPSNFDHGTKIVLFFQKGKLDLLDETQLGLKLKQMYQYNRYPFYLHVKGNGEHDKQTIRIDSQLLWRKKQSLITEQDYIQYFKTITKSPNPEYLAPPIHVNYEGQLEFSILLLFIPKRAIWSTTEYLERLPNLNLHVRRILVREECQELVPNYMNFLEGVIDSEDLPIDISLDTIKENKILKVINRNIVRRILDELFRLIEEDKQSFLIFYMEYGSVLQAGIGRDIYSDKIVKLLEIGKGMYEDIVMNWPKTHSQIEGKCSELVVELTLVLKDKLSRDLIHLIARRFILFSSIKM